MSIISNQEWDAGSSWEMIKLGRPSRTNGRKRLDGNSTGRLLCTAEDNEWMNKNYKTQIFSIVWMYVEGAVSIRGLKLESNSSFNEGSFKISSGFMQKWGIFPYTQKSTEWFS